MKLKDKSKNPIGGYVFHDEVLDKDFSSGTFRTLIGAVEMFYRSNSIEIPPNLPAIIEDQICMRQPPGRCWYEKKTGDQISRVIHSAASIVDKVFKTKIEPRVRGCRGCGQRRMKLNS